LALYNRPVLVLHVSAVADADGCTASAYLRTAYDLLLARELEDGTPYGGVFHPSLKRLAERVYACRAPLEGCFVIEGTCTQPAPGAALRSASTLHA